MLVSIPKKKKILIVIRSAAARAAKLIDADEDGGIAETITDQCAVVDQKICQTADANFTTAQTNAWAEVDTMGSYLESVDAITHPENINWTTMTGYSTSLQPLLNAL
jgi:hypothetical protein